MFLSFSMESPDFVGTAPKVRGMRGRSPAHRVDNLTVNYSLYDVKEIMKIQTPSGLTFLRTGNL